MKGTKQLGISQRHQSLKINTLTRQLLSTQTDKMMKLFVLGCLLAVAVYAKPADKKYTTKYDNIDLDEILNNERLFNNYFNCLMNNGKCTPDGSELKESLPDALATACSKCSEKQKVGSEKVIRFLIEKKPEQYAQLEKKYDAEGKYKAKYQAEAAKRGIKV